MQTTLSSFYTSLSDTNVEVLIPAGTFSALEIEQRVVPTIVGLIKNWIFLFPKGDVWVQEPVRHRVQQ